MDISSLALSMTQFQTNNSIGVAMLSNSLDLSQNMGEALIAMIDKSAMEQSVNPNLGGNFDMSV